MIKKKIGAILFLLSIFTIGVNAQRATSMRINEVLVINQDNYINNYGTRSGWIELYNSSAGSVNIAGCFLTNEKGNPKKYTIPKGDVLTIIQPHQHTLFWADGDPNKGTFHINFVLDPSKENYLAIYDTDGRTLIDEIMIPAGQIADVSYGRIIDGKDKWDNMAKVTPSTNNLTLDSNKKIDSFKQNDGLGIAMTLTSMSVVFLGLIFLYLIFKQIGRFSIKASKLKALKASGGNIKNEDGEISGEVLAAIGTALYEMNDASHDIENTVLTIHKVARTYSPWSSKIYGLREVPKK